MTELCEPQTENQGTPIPLEQQISASRSITPSKISQLKYPTKLTKAPNLNDKLTSSKTVPLRQSESKTAMKS